MAALATPASALEPPPGYVGAILTGQAPEGSQSMAAFARRKDCGKSLTVLVERDGHLLPASGRIVCRN